MEFDGVAARFTAAGSASSCLAILPVLLFFVETREQQRSIRHALLINLFLAVFLNAFNNTISGFIYVDTHELQPGSACATNGFFAQLTAQAVDFTILAIMLLTLLTVTGFISLPGLSVRWKKLVICVCTWIFPMITSIVAVSMDQMQPIDRNWCWIPPTQLSLRYALVQSWWLAIIFLTISLFMWWFAYPRLAPYFSSPKYTGDIYVRVKSTDLGSSSQRASDPAFHGQAEGKRFSEFSLPIQGKKGSADGRHESPSRWKFVRQPDVNNSFRSCPRAAAERLCPVPRSFDVPQQPPFSGLPPPVTNSVDSGLGMAPSLASKPDLSLFPPRYHNQCPKVSRSYSVSVGTPTVAPSTASSGVLPGGSSGPGLPQYHSQCPKVRRTFEVTTEGPQGKDPLPSPGARYHNQCPKVIKSIEISSSTPAPHRTALLPFPPAVHAPILRADGCTYTTTISSPTEPPPSPVPGLPPPPWTPSNARDADNGQPPSWRRTFLFSKSTWSDSTASRRGSSSPHARALCRRRTGDHETRRALLLAVYPLTYVVVCMPAVVQCLLEARGVGVSARVAGGLVGTREYFGLASAVVFAVVERRRLRVLLGLGGDAPRGPGGKGSFESEDV